MKNIIKTLVTILFLCVLTNTFSQNRLSSLKFDSDINTKFRFNETKIDLKLHKNYSDNRDKKIGCAVLIFAGIAFITASALENYDSKINQTSEIKLPSQIMMGVGIGFTLGGSIGLATLSGK